MGILKFICYALGGLLFGVPIVAFLFLLIVALILLMLNVIRDLTADLAEPIQDEMEDDDYDR